MDSLLRRIIILVIAIIIIVPTIYFTYNFYYQAAGVKDPSSYIPGNSTFVARYNYYNESYYAFYGNGSLGAVFPVTGTYVSGLINSSMSLLTNTSMNITFSLGETYQGVQIFEISNISISRLVTGLMGSLLNANLTGVSSFLPSELDNQTVYFASPYSSLTIIGTLSAVKWSIDSHNTGKTFLAKENIYFNRQSNLSFYFKASGVYLNYVSGNITNNVTHAFISLNPANISYDFLLISSLANNYSYNIRFISNSLMEVTLPVGYQDVLLYLMPLSSSLNITNAEGF